MGLTHFLFSVFTPLEGGVCLLQIPSFFTFFFTVFTLWGGNGKLESHLFFQCFHCGGGLGGGGKISDVLKYILLFSFIS